MELFRDLGEPYSGPVFLYTDNRNPLRVLMPRLQKEQGGVHDVVLVPDHPHVKPQESALARESNYTGNLRVLAASRSYCQQQNAWSFPCLYLRIVDARKLSIEVLEV